MIAACEGSDLLVDPPTADDEVTCPVCLQVVRVGGTPKEPRYRAHNRWLPDQVEYPSLGDAMQSAAVSGIYAPEMDEDAAEVFAERLQQNRELDQRCAAEQAEAKL